MNRPHPASLLLLGFAVLVAASSRQGAALYLSGALLATTATFAAAARWRALLGRSRWLLLSLLVLFGWMTPGTPVPGVPGATAEGLALAAEHLMRLLLALAVVALLLRTLAVAELVAGVRALMAPLAPFRVSRDRFAVRLALTLNEVEAARGGEIRDGHDVLHLPAAEPGLSDWLLVAAAVSLLVGAWLT